MIDPWPSLGGWFFAGLVVAGFMVAANLFLVLKLLPRGEGVPHLGTVLWVGGFLIMSVCLWASLIFAVLNPGPNALAAVFLAGNSMMGVIGIWTIGLFYRAEEKRLPRDGRAWPTLFTLLVLGGELLMGMTFVLGAEGPGPFASMGYPGLIELLAASIGSIWFAVAMVSTMVVVVLWLPLDRSERRALFAFSVIPLGIPFALAYPIAGAAAAGLLMVALLVVLLSELLGTRAPAPGFVRLGIALSIALGVMAAGVLGYELAPGSAGGAASFAAPTFAVMAVELWVLIRWGFRGGASVSEQVTTITSVPSPAGQSRPLEA